MTGLVTDIPSSSDNTGTSEEKLSFSFIAFQDKYCFDNMTLLHKNICKNI